MDDFTCQIQCEEVYLADFDGGEIEFLSKESFDVAVIERGYPVWVEKVAA